MLVINHEKYSVLHVAFLVTHRLGLGLAVLHNSEVLFPCYLASL